MNEWNGEIKIMTPKLCLPSVFTTRIQLLALKQFGLGFAFDFAFGFGFSFGMLCLSVWVSVPSEPEFRYFGFGLNSSFG